MRRKKVHKLTSQKLSCKQFQHSMHTSVDLWQIIGKKSYQLNNGFAEEIRHLKLTPKLLLILVESGQTRSSTLTCSLGILCVEDSSQKDKHSGQMVNAPFQLIINHLKLSQHQHNPRLSRRLSRNKMKKRRKLHSPKRSRIKTLLLLLKQERSRSKLKSQPQLLPLQQAMPCLTSSSCVI